MSRERIPGGIMTSQRNEKFTPDAHFDA